MWEDFRAGFAYWLMAVAARIYPPLISEVVAMTTDALLKDHNA